MISWKLLSAIIFFIFLLKNKKEIFVLHFGTTQYMFKKKLVTPSTFNLKKSENSRN